MQIYGSVWKRGYPQMLILSINLNLTLGSYYDPPSKKHQIWGYPEVVDELINIKKKWDPSSLRAMNGSGAVKRTNPQKRSAARFEFLCANKVHFTGRWFNLCLRPRLLSILIWVCLRMEMPQCLEKWPVSWAKYGTMMIQEWIWLDLAMPYSQTNPSWCFHSACCLLQRGLQSVKTVQLYKLQQFER